MKTGFKQQPWRLIFVVLFSPILAFSALFHLDKAIPKSFLLWSLTCFKGKKKSILFLKEFVFKSIDPIWFEESIPEFEKLRQKNIEIVIISASGSYWLREALRHKFSHFRMIIGSKLGFFAGGVIYKSKNCYQEEKIKRIWKILGKDFFWHSSYSDHVADIPLLKQASLRYLVNPTPQHQILFKTELNGNYETLSWKKIYF